MKRITEYHHFKGSNLGPVEEIERWIVNTIEKSEIRDEQRDSSKCWEIKHSSGVIQFARLLAQRRGLDESIAAIALALHDIYCIETGKYENHARLGGASVRRVLMEAVHLDEMTTNIIVNMVEKHSEKHIFTNDPYVELAKDVDVLDCFFYPDAEHFYLTMKPLSICKHYFRRISKIRQELGLPRYPRYECLDKFKPGWMSSRGSMSFDTFESVLSTLFPEDYNPKAEVGSVAAFLYLPNGVIQSYSVDPFLVENEKKASRRDLAEILDLFDYQHTSLLVCWPAFNAYEIYQNESAYSRLAMLETASSITQVKFLGE